MASRHWSLRRNSTKACCTMEDGETDTTQPLLSNHDSQLLGLNPVEQAGLKVFLFCFVLFFSQQAMSYQPRK